MLTLLQKQKQTHFFNVIDFDNNGVIEEDDFEAIGDNLCIVRDFDIDTPEYNTIMSMTSTIWSNLTPYIDGNEGTLDHWLAFMDELLDPTNSDRYERYITDFVSTLFKLFDINDDGFISQTEYIDLFIGLRIEVRFAPKAFRNLDENNDGRLSHDEILHSVNEFFKSDNPGSAGNWLFGGWDDN